MTGPDLLVVTLTQSQLAALVRDAVVEVLAEHEPANGAQVLLDRRGLARALGCGVDSVDRLRREGCPELRLGDVVRFALDDVLTWLRAREVERRLHQPAAPGSGEAENGSDAPIGDVKKARTKKHAAPAVAIPRTSERGRESHRRPGVSVGGAR